MKIAFVADVHVGNHKRFGGPISAGLNQRCELIVDALHSAYWAAKDRGCSMFVVLGDLFDSDRPNPQTVAAVQHVFDIEEDGMLVGLLNGNHDQHSYEEMDGALAPLCDHADVWERPYVAHHQGVSMFMVPYQPGPAHEWLPREVAAIAKDAKYSQRILCLHLGIADKATPPWLAGADDSIEADTLKRIMKQHGISVAFAGNWHDHRAWKGNQTIVQAGSLCPTGWNNPGLEGYGRVVFWDSETKEISYQEIPGPRFISRRIADNDKWPSVAAEIAEACPQANTLFLQLVVPPERLAEFLEIASQKDDAFYAIEVVPDRTEAEVAARSAAQAASSVDTLEKAVAAYISEMPLERGVSRDRVQQRSREYLGL